jgi:hypothetical protein
VVSGEKKNGVVKVQGALDVVGMLHKREKQA